MARSGSFPLSLALQLLSRHCPPGAVVLDPFCGKGTTLFAARILGLSAYGLDIAPEAVLCSRAKLANVQRGEIIDYINGLPLRGNRKVKIPRRVKAFFHRDTLEEIIQVRDALSLDLGGRNHHNAQFCLAALLGILHGHASYSLSISSAHAFAMSPTYVRSYAARHNLTKPKRNVKDCLIQKISRCLTSELPPPVPGQVAAGSALNSAQIFQTLCGGVDVILTSPPYLHAQTYLKDNWLRHWLLNIDSLELKGNYIQTSSCKRYQHKMFQVFDNLAKLLRPGGLIICVAGDVRIRCRGPQGTKRMIISTARLLMDVCKLPMLDLTLEESGTQGCVTTGRYLHALVHSNGHSKRGLPERYFVARKRTSLKNAH